MGTVSVSYTHLPVLQRLYPDALQTYLTVTHQHRFAGGPEHIGRNHRIAESAAMCMMAGIEIRPPLIAPLTGAAQQYVTAPSFYLARFLKQDVTGLNKTIFTRVTGMLLGPTQSFALYNARQSKMKWNGMGEFKALQILRDVSYAMTGQASDSAVLFGASPDSLMPVSYTHLCQASPQVLLSQVFHLPSNPMAFLKYCIRTAAAPGSTIVLNTARRAAIIRCMRTVRGINGLPLKERLP